MYAASSRERCARTLPADFLVAGDATPLKKMLPALFITVFLIMPETGAVGLITAAWNNQMVVICTIAVVAVSEKTSSGRSVVNNASVALLLDLPEVISLAGAMEEVFLTWHAMAS